MKRGARNHPIGIRDKLRNKRISKKRAKGERPFAVTWKIAGFPVIKNVFNSGKVMVTTLNRVRVKCMFSAFHTFPLESCYNTASNKRCVLL